MKNWESMTSDERAIAVLTERCGWVIKECDFPASCCGNNCTGGYDAGSQGCFPYGSFPPILTSADAAIEHVGKAIEEKEMIWVAHSSEREVEILTRLPSDPSGWIVAGAGVADDNCPNWLATALCEAAHRMVMEGEEG